MFYVDERFYKSDPVIAIPRAHRAAAIGLWTLAGTWSRDFLKDGFVPAHMIEELGGTTELADMLVDLAKLWRRRGSGYQFKDWKKWQDTRESVEAKRAAWRERQNRHRGKSGEESGSSNADVTRESPHPRPRPLPQTDDDDGRPPRQPQDGSAHVSGAVDNSTEYPAVLAAAAEQLSKIAGEPISTLQAGVVVDEILGRGGARVRNPRRYVLGTLRVSGPEWLQFALTGKEPS